MKMKSIHLTLLALVFAGLASAAEEAPPGVVISPDKGEISSDTSFTVSFPDDMIPGEQINAGDVPWPIVIEPKLDGRFLWQSPTEGELQLRGPLIPGTHYRVSTAPGLKDVKGKPVPPQRWEYESEPFTVESDEDQREGLSAKPRFDVRANYPVAVADAAEHIFFQDRDSHERFPVEVLLSPGQTAGQEKRLTVTPRHPLPVGHTFDLMVDDLRDAVGRKPLAFLNVFPAGTTSPMELSWVGAFNHALQKPRIRAKFSESIDPESITPEAITVTPAVPGMKLLAEQDELVAEGDFSPTQRYVVRIGTSLRGVRGFGLVKEEKWGATFKPKESTIVLPYTQVFQRSARGLKFSFLQVNTGPATWTLSEIPLAQLPALLERVKDYQTGEKPLALKVVGEGKFDANAGAEEVLRQIDWQPPKLLSGPYLLQVTAPGSDGEIVGNRTIVSFSEYMLTQKVSDRKVYLRVAKMGDISGLANAPVRVVTRENVELATAQTDANGVAVFDHERLYPATGSGADLFIAETPGGPAIQDAGGTTLASAEYHNRDDRTDLRSLIVTDRNLYRPGQTVKMHGLARLAKRGELSLPPAGEVQWKIKPADGDETASGAATLSTRGSWEAEWVIPTTLATGLYEIACDVAGLKAFHASFRVEEYRVPLFSIELEKGAPPLGASVRVASNYFHGAPNAGGKIRWKARWMTVREIEDDQFIRSDRYSENHLSGDEEKEAEGEAVLDKEGRALVQCEPPFQDEKKRGRCLVAWTIDVTSPEAQTLTAGLETNVQMEQGWVGIKAEIRGEKTIAVEIDAVNVEDEPVKGAPVRVDLYHVTAKTVREKVGPFIVRYRNTRDFAKVATREVQTPAKLDFPVENTGEYVAVAVSPGQVLASTDLTVAGEEQAELPVVNETEIDVSLPEPARPYLPGETVPLSIRAPFAGVAWVSVEAEEVLDTLFVPLAGNAGRIDLPIRKEYAPNATVTVYLVQPGGANALPRERIGQVKLEVARPDRAVEVKPVLAVDAKVRPGGPVRGEVVLTSEGRPVQGAEVLVFAVDEAVLRLGGWEMPDPAAIFYPPRQLSVSSYAALTRYVEQIERRSLHQKGYVIGDGGEALGQVSSVRKELKTLAFWQAGLASDAKGKVAFDFQAPDNLTEFRLVAFAHTNAHQFGGGTTTFKVSKPLLVEPALPRFVRVGDEVMLRAVARQSVKDSGQITVRCLTEGIELEASQPITQEAPRDVPAVFNFKGRVSDVSSGAKVRFEATSNLGEGDIVETSLPILPPTVLRRETVARAVQAATFQPAAAAPASWLKGRGAFTLTLSTSPWLPKLNGLPAILEYPHGCFEQISTRVLSYALMSDLLQNLPDAQAREAHYRGMLQSSFKRYEEGLTPQGLVPYWPGGSMPNYFVTALAAWAVREADEAGIEVSAELSKKLAGALEKIIAGQELKADPLTRALALMVSATPEQAAQFSSVAEDLYLKRDRLTDEGRAMLAIGMHRLKALPKEKTQLLKEISKPPAERAFDPETFASTTRAEALTTLALGEITPDGPLLKERRERMLKLMDSAASLSTQENLWLLLAFKAMHDARPAIVLADRALNPAPPLVSKNQTAVAWAQNDIARIKEFQVDGLPAGTPLSALMSAEYRSTEPEAERTDRGLRIERVVRNLTEPKRNGSGKAPYKLGDQLLITYRLLSRHLHHYVALEDLLPAGLETVNPNLPLIAKTYQIPAEVSGRELMLSHSELRDQSTCLYFDVVPPGVGIYSVLARATTAGSFRWPATQAYPMYDSRFTGLSTAGVCEVSE